MVQKKSNFNYISFRNAILGFFYRNLLKRIFFLRDPEEVHDRMIRVGKLLGNYSLTKKIAHFVFDFYHPSLEQKVLGITFKNPIGLAAGFDKNAELTQILPSVGFGFEEVGSITGEPCEGNPKPRLWRLKKSKSLLVYYGLKNDGAEVLSSRLRNKTFEFPVGISIAKTNSPDTCDTARGIADYIKAYKAFSDIGSYYTINISCPNAFGGEPFTDKVKLEQLLKEISLLPKTKPIFIKISPDLSNEEIDDIIDVAGRYSVDGFVISNLTKKRGNPKIVDESVPDKGGMSGKVVEDLSNRLIEYVYKKTNGKFVIIGCGGVFSAEDAYKKIKLGASLIHMITGMIFEGPQVISEINKGLVKLLQEDGYQNISEAVGRQ